MDKSSIRQAKITIDTYRHLHKGADPTSDMVSNYFLDDDFYTLKYDSKKKEWRLTEHKKTEEVVIDEIRDYS